MLCFSDISVLTPLSDSGIQLLRSITICITYLLSSTSQLFNIIMMVYFIVMMFPLMKESHIICIRESYVEVIFLFWWTLFQEKLLNSMNVMMTMLFPKSWTCHNFWRLICLMFKFSKGYFKSYIMTFHYNYFLFLFFKEYIWFT